MKKTSKKLVALVLSLVMVLSFSVNTFAATVTPVTASVEFDMSEYDSEMADQLYLPSVKLPTSGTDFTTLFNIPSNVNHIYKDQITVMDMTIEAADELGLKEYVGYDWDTSNYNNTPDGCYMYEFLGYGTMAVDYNYSSVPGESYWNGYSWVLYVNGEKPELYASNILAQNGDKIVWKYEYSETIW